MRIQFFTTAGLAVAFSFFIHSLALGQKNNDLPAGWHLLDKKTDGYQGISLQKAYDFLKGKNSEKVIVAVLDGGTDTTHEDLKAVLWRNPKEIPGNQKDDDGNGLADDYFGWNYLGHADGTNINKENLEAVRVYHQLKDKFGNNTVANTDDPDYAIWQQAMKKLDVGPEERFNFRLIKATTEALQQQDKILQIAMGREEFTLDLLEAFQPADNDAKRARMGFLRTAQMLEMEGTMTNTAIMKDLTQYLEMQDALINAATKPFTNYRDAIRNDAASMDVVHYGNADVMGGDAKHGTHVSGIIGAIRGNGLGMDGVADNVTIMTLRVVPDGDEYDKDIALGIRYAVDHGAKVINMSFGKDVSPQQQWVEDAIRYAAEKDVLLVHAAGNDGQNLDENENFPTQKMKDGTLAGNMITIGASGDLKYKDGLAASFTNYGKAMVDVLAPGVRIYSTVPAGNQYSFEQGTSMAAPVVSGIAALIRGYYPSLSAAEVKAILMESADLSYATENTKKPGGGPKDKIQFGELSASGGIVNAYNALKMAEERAAAKQKNR